MARRHDIDDLLRSWPYQPGEISVRLVKARGGRDVLQMRVEMGVIQLETEHRPDGWRPEGAETYFDYLLALSIHAGDDFVLTDEQCAEADREFMQFYQRRICWLALREFRRAVRDADHNLGFMDFVRHCSPNEEWTASHEQYRPFVLFHRTQAEALAELDEVGPEAAIEVLTRGMDEMREVCQQLDVEPAFEDEEMIERLAELRESLRDRYEVGQTLHEQLADAVGHEDYERAARLRDEIARRKPRRA